MTERSKSILVRLSEKEKIYVQTQAANAALKTETYCRKVLLDHEVKPKQPADITKLLDEIKAIGNNINQIAHRANLDNIATDTMIKQAIQLQQTIWEKVKAM